MGGSLLSLPDIPQRLGAVLRQLTAPNNTVTRSGGRVSSIADGPAIAGPGLPDGQIRPPGMGVLSGVLSELRPLIVCGGGESADLVRRWQLVHGLSDEQAHWLAFRAVSINEVLMSHLLPNAIVVKTRDELQAMWKEARLPILAAESFVRHEEAQAADPLPHDWSVTGDSIAAWVARRLNAHRLVLLKSCDLPDNASLAEAAARHLVDSCFPACAAELEVCWVNLRADEPQLRTWRTAGGDQRSSLEPLV